MEPNGAWEEWFEVEVALAWPGGVRVGCVKGR